MTWTPEGKSKGGQLKQVRERTTEKERDEMGGRAAGKQMKLPWIGHL